jgi:hypothetical protein
MYHQKIVEYIVIQLVKKVFEHPVLVSYKDFIQINPLERRVLVKLMYDRELCLLYSMKVFGEKKEHVSKLKIIFCEKS